MTKTFYRDGAKVTIENGLYSYNCGECDRSSEDNKNLYETGYYTKTVHITCKCNHKYEYTN